ncbi:MAG: YwqG family protein [Chloroflexota bacterium]|nr:YwqG family protein [Chloroflexota bacterium]
MNTPDHIIQRTFAEVDRLLRPASLAEVGGFRPPPDPVSSWFGGHFVGAHEEQWPTSRGKLMLPLLQIRIDELPYVPPGLDGIALLNVFIDAEELPVDTPNGDGWLIRTYPSIDSLHPLIPPLLTGQVKTFPVRWTLATREAPQRGDVWEILAATGFDQLEHDIELFSERYSRSYGTKVGGWPSYIQGEPAVTDEFVFQIGSEAKAHWAWGDAGIGYFYRTRAGEWSLY